MRRLVGKGQSDNVGDPGRRGAAHEQMHQSVDQQGGLAGPRSRRDHDVAIESGGG